MQRLPQQQREKRQKHLKSHDSTLGDSGVQEVGNFVVGVCRNGARPSGKSARVVPQSAMSKSLSNNSFISNLTDFDAFEDLFGPGGKRPSNATTATMRNERSIFGSKRWDTTVDVLPGFLSNLMEASETNEIHDPKEIQKSLLDAFPESLKLITIDEAMQEAMISGNAEGSEDSGYYRQFTELVLREVYFLLVRTATAYDSYKNYLLQQCEVSLDETNLKTLKLSVIEESTCNLSEWDDAWYDVIDHKIGVLHAVTVRPPKLLAGMLWNGVDRFLLGGTTFIEEGRILQIWLERGSETSAAPTLVPREGAEAQLNANALGHSVNSGNSKQKTLVRFLLREFISVSKTGMGCVMQTFSLIPDNFSVTVPRCQTLPYSIIQTVLDQCEVGALSRAFSLQLLLPASMRYSPGSLGIEPMSSSAGLSSGLLWWQNNADLEATVSERTSSFSEGALYSTFSGTIKRGSIKPKALRRQPLGDETYLRFTNSKLFACVMQHSPALLTASANIIREYLKYSQRLRFRSLVRQLIWAVKTIQRFFRRCLCKKRRATKRMLLLWCKLEMESREKLKEYTVSPTASSQIDFIVATVLWQHILTTENYKLAVLAEMQLERRLGFRKWCAQRVEEERLKQAAVCGKTKTFLAYSDKLCVNEGGKICGGGGGSSDNGGGGTTNELSGIDKYPSAVRTKEQEEEATNALVSKENINKLQYAWILKWRDVVHARFGWYIDPELLLQESHHRLLLSLRKSILAMSEVHKELKKNAFKCTAEAT